MTTKKENDGKTSGKPPEDVREDVREVPPDTENPVATETPADAPPAKAAPRQEEEEALESRLLRLQADFDNYRKRTLRERAEWNLRAKEELLLEILPVVDHFELGLKTAARHETDTRVTEGFQMIYDQLLGALNKHQVAPITAEGQEFDPNRHEAVTFVPSEEHPAHHIIAETRRGYLLGERLLRAAQVVVSSGSVNAADTTDQASQDEAVTEEQC